MGKTNKNPAISGVFIFLFIFFSVCVDLTIFDEVQVVFLSPCVLHGLSVIQNFLRIRQIRRWCLDRPEVQVYLFLCPDIQ